jgi:polysaccharide export outer membrane protein
MNMQQKILISFLFGMLFLTSCTVFYPSRMLSTGKDFSYTPLPLNAPEDPYKLAPNDELNIVVSTNSGQNLINPIEGAQTNTGGNTQTYLIDFDSTINLPLLRRVKIGGLSLVEAQRKLETEFSFYFNDPYVQIKVTNNRVIIFPGGEGGSASVVKLESPHTTLFEALAVAGGITDGKAYNIKLIRGKLNDRKVYKIDLSTMNGLVAGDIVLQANDIIYVEPVNRLPQAILREITPYLTLATTMLLIYGLFR